MLAKTTDVAIADSTNWGGTISDRDVSDWYGQESYPSALQCTSENGSGTDCADIQEHHGTGNLSTETCSQTGAVERGVLDRRVLMWRRWGNERTGRPSNGRCSGEGNPAKISGSFECFSSVIPRSLLRGSFIEGPRHDCMTHSPAGHDLQRRRSDGAAVSCCPIRMA